MSLFPLRAATQGLRNLSRLAIATQGLRAPAATPPEVVPLGSSYLYAEEEEPAMSLMRIVTLFLGADLGGLTARSVEKSTT